MMGHPPRGTASSGVRRVVAATALALLAAGAPRVTHAQPDLSTVEEQIVTVRAFDEADAVLGDISGVASGGGLVVTSAHMLRGAATIVVIDGGGAEHPATVRSSDERSGVAVLDAEGLETAGALFAPDDPDANPDVDDLTYVPRFTADGSLDAVPAPGLISEVRRLDPVVPGEPALLIYRHNAGASAREYGMPMLNDCGEVTGLIRTDPDMSLRDLNDRAGPGESTFGVAAAEVRRALTEEGAEVDTAAEACPGTGDTREILEAEAQRAQEEANAAAEEATAAREEAETAREQAEAAEQRAAELEADAGATEAERDTARAEAEEARAEAEQAQAEADESEAELDDMEERAERAQLAAEESQERVAELELRQRLLYSLLAVGVGLLLAGGISVWFVMRQRRRQLEAADAGRREAEHAAEAERRRSEEAMAGAVRPAPLSCLLEGTDDAGRNVVVKIDAAQLGVPEGIVVGRNPAQAGALLDHPEASREHFRLTVRDDDLFIEDLNSTNGTLVDGTALPAGQSARLADGAKIGVGAAIEVRVTITPEQQP